MGKRDGASAVEQSAAGRVDSLIAGSRSLGIDLLNGDLELLSAIRELGCESFIDLPDKSVSTPSTLDTIGKCIPPRCQYPPSTNPSAQEALG